MHKLVRTQLKNHQENTHTIYIYIYIYIYFPYLNFMHKLVNLQLLYRKFYGDPIDLIFCKIISSYTRNLQCHSSSGTQNLEASFLQDVNYTCIGVVCVCDLRGLTISIPVVKDSHNCLRKHLIVCIYIYILIDY